MQKSISEFKLGEVGTILLEIYKEIAVVVFTAFLFGSAMLWIVNKIA